MKREMKKTKKKKNEKIIEKQRYITIKNKQEREWVKKEMLRTLIHVRDTPRVPIGDVLIKCCSVTEHCDNERGWERVCIHSNNSLLLRKICFN